MSIRAGTSVRSSTTSINVNTDEFADARKSSDLQNHAHRECGGDSGERFALSKLGDSRPELSRNWESGFNREASRSLGSNTTWRHSERLHPFLFHAIFADDVEYQDRL